MKRFLYMHTHTHTHYNIFHTSIMSEVKIAHLYALILERLVVCSGTLIFPRVFFLVLCKCESLPDSNLYSIFKTDAYVDTV